MRELELLGRVYNGNAALPADVTIPPGDDMGAVQFGTQQVLVAVDQVAEGPHFQLGKTPIAKIGRKALTRNLSDIAAMAARPIGAVVATCLPKGLGDVKAIALLDAIRSTAEHYECPLFGGDISMWDGPLVASVTVLADTDGMMPILRRGALVDDVVCVTGRLGGSGTTVDGYTHHLDFEPRIKLARAIANRVDIHAMIDISDGLARDLGHICRASSVCAQIDVGQVPLSTASVIQAQHKQRAPWQSALGDGEDYELCFTVAADQHASSLPAEIDDVPITVVGRITASSKQKPGSIITLNMPDGTRRSGDDLGWEHYS